MERTRGKRARFPHGKVRVKCVEKTGRILRFLAERPEGVPLKELSQELGIIPSTLHHLLATMKAVGYIEEEEEKYRIGLGLVELVFSYLAKTDLFTASHPEAKRLRDKFNQTVAVISYRGGKEFPIIELPNRSYIQVNLVFSQGDVPTLHATASGKILLAYSTPDVFSDYINGKGLHKFTSNTITDPKALQEELERIKEQGYALDRGEYREEILGVFAPIFDAHRDLVGAIGIITLLFKHSQEEIEEFIKGLTEAGKKISSKLGYVLSE
ncbi:IclR family transcriptional regulator [bacterium]|nr:IclR family transcriptional regulator [bacterium]